jgi:hypothetical protein
MKIFFHKFLFLSLFFFLSCAGGAAYESYRPLTGDWKTERGIIMSIHKSVAGGVTATVKTAPGFIDEKLNPGKSVISHIKPLVNGGYRGVFQMPDGLKPVKVKLALTAYDTLLIMTWDSRAKSKVMRWKRVEKIPVR